MNRNEYVKIMKFLQSNFPNHKIPPETFKVWYLVYERLDYNPALLRVLDAVENEKFFPYPEYFCNDIYTGYKFYIDNKCGSAELANNLKRIKGVIE